MFKQKFRFRVQSFFTLLLSLASSSGLWACAAVQPRFQAQATPVQAQSAPKRYLSGSAADVKPELHGPALLLAGGGEDQLAAMQWQIDRLRGCSDCPAKLDLVVLRASGADGYNSLITELKGLDSIESIVFDQRAQAFEQDVVRTVSQAEIVFFAGGDQCKYMQYFQDSPLQQAVKSVYARGGGVGGTSAGLAIQGSLVYDACSGSITSAEALQDPFAPALTLSRGLFDWPLLKGVLTDTHFAQRDRMGRLFSFISRAQLQNPGVMRALAVDEATALGLEATGQAQVFGQHRAYLVEASTQPEVCLPKQSLSHANFAVNRLTPGQRFSFSWPQPESYRVDVQAGKLSRNPY